MTEIPWLGILVAAIVAMGVDRLWYAPWAFGGRWMKGVGLDEAKLARASTSALPVQYAASLIAAYILTHFIVYAHNAQAGTWLGDACLTAFWAWLGLSATTIVLHGVLEPRDRAIMLINIGSSFVSLQAMAIVLGITLS